jgi:hypothetical protein
MSYDLSSPSFVVELIAEKHSVFTFLSLLTAEAQQSLLSGVSFKDHRQS